MKGGRRYEAGEHLCGRERHEPAATQRFSASAGFLLVPFAMNVIPIGYKQTEAGVIPEDWNVRRLKESCSKVTDGTHDTPKPVKSGVPFLTAIHVKDNRISYEDCLYVTKEDHDVIYKRCNPEMGDVLVVNIGAGVATSALVDVDFEFSLKNVALLKPSAGSLSGAYLNYCLSHRKAGITQALSSGGAQPFLSLNQIGDIAIPMPPILEQRAIATALSDVDTLLAKLDQLIAKKRDLKQATMQQLLTGETRLPGFGGAWEVKRLGDVLRVRHGKSQHSVETQDGRYPILATGGEIGRTDISLYDMPSVLIGRKGTIDKPQFRDTPFWTVDTLFYTEIFGANSAKFLFYKFDMIDWRCYNEASGVPSLNASTIENIEINLPRPEEQTAIATVLSDMDAELADLEARRDKIRALKQGMMQELLTGRIRLVGPDARHRTESQNLAAVAAT